MSVVDCPGKMSAYERTGIEPESARSYKYRKTTNRTMVSGSMAGRPCSGQTDDVNLTQGMIGWDHLLKKKSAK